jgi:uncharacterized protein (UPF0264 family)
MVVDRGRRRAGSVGLLASVASLAEVELAVAFDADLIDLKDPAQGALGAWPVELIPAAVALVAGRLPVSATVGDLPMEPTRLLAAAQRTAETEVDLVKIGFFAGGDPRGCVAALGQAARGGIRLVAVLMADQGALDLALLPALRDAGFQGAMLDTADKVGGGLRRHLGPELLARFVGDAKALGLLTGLAGSLNVADVAPLATLGPDYLGFRGALCRGTRAGALDRAAFAAVRAALDRAGPLAA